MYKYIICNENRDTFTNLQYFVRSCQELVGTAVNIVCQNKNLTCNQKKWLKKNGVKIEKNCVPNISCDHIFLSDGQIICETNGSLIHSEEGLLYHLAYIRSRNINIVKIKPNIKRFRFNKSIINTLKRRYYNPDTGEVIGQVNRKDIFIPQLS